MQRAPLTADCPVLPHSPAPSSPPQSDAPAQPAVPSNPPIAPSAAPPPKPRGFQLISKQQHRLIASRGGKAAHALGLAHQYTPEEALLAGRKGGAVVSRDREHMAEIGRKGALARRLHRGAKPSPAAPLTH